jgi:hypothetical protein
MRSFALLAGLSLSWGCASSTQYNRPLDAAVGDLARTGFARSATTWSYQSSVYASAATTTSTTQAASVVEGPRGDRLWRISNDGTFLEFCQLLDERPYDCEMVPLPIAGAPTLIEPGHLGAGTLVSQDSKGNVWFLSGELGRRTVTLPTTPRFGVWVLNRPHMTGVSLLGAFRLGAALAFCSLDEAGRPRCTDAKTSISRAFSVHVTGLASPPPVPAPAPVEPTEPAQPEAPAPTPALPSKIGHVLWGQPVDEGVALRCEADEVSATVKCVKAQEKTQP